MAPLPASFQKIADAAVGGNRYVNLNPLWDYVTSKHSAFAEKAKGVGQRGTIPNAIIEALKNIMTEMNNANRRKKKKGNASSSAGSGSNGNGAAPQRKRTDNQSNELECIGTEDLLWADDGQGGMDTVPLVDPEDFGPDGKTRATYMSAARSYKLMLTWQDADAFSGAAAAFCKKVSYDELLSKVNRKLLDKFTHTQCKLFFVGKTKTVFPHPSSRSDVFSC